MRTYFCEDCGQGGMVAGGRGPVPTLCPKHRKEKRQIQTKERVRKLRQKGKVKRDRKGSFVIHLRLSKDGPTCCGADQDTMAVGEWFFTHRGDNWHYCKRCARIWEKHNNMVLPK